MNCDFDYSKTLSELEGIDVGEPEFNSHLVQTCNRLYKTPLNKFNAEDLRIMIGQNIGLPYLVPMAIELLESNILLEGDLFPGDLLKSVIRVDVEFWKLKPDLKQKIEEILSNTIHDLSVQLKTFKNK